MFDIGGWEFLLIAILGIIIVGPKELPGAIRTVSMFVRRARELARDFQSGLEDVAREAELHKVTDELKGIVDPTSTFGGLRTEIEEAVDPEGDIRGSMKFDTDWSDDDLIDYSDPEFADDNTIQPSADEESAVEKSESEQASPPSPPDSKEASGDKPVSTEPPKGDAADGDSKTGGSA